MEEDLKLSVQLYTGVPTGPLINFQRRELSFLFRAVRWLMTSTLMVFTGTIKLSILTSMTIQIEFFLSITLKKAIGNDLELLIEPTPGNTPKINALLLIDPFS